MATKQVQKTPAKQAAPAAKPVAKAASTAVVNIDKDLEAQLAADAGSGFEEASRDSFATPFLRILQDLSPQVKSKMAGYIQGAKPGNIFNTVSGELYDSIRVIPCHFSQCFIEWKPREGEGGGGFVARYDVALGAQKMASAVRDGGKAILLNGNELMDTREHYVLFVNEETGESEGALIALTSSGLKISKRWMSQMRAAVIQVAGRLVNSPMFAWDYKLSAIEEANDKGQWYQWEISDRRRVTDVDLYSKAKSFGLAMKAGQGKVNYDELATQHRETGGDVPGDLNNEIDA